MAGRSHLFGLGSTRRWKKILKHKVKNTNHPRKFFNVCSLCSKNGCPFFVVSIQKREITKICSPFAVKYFLLLTAGKWRCVTNRIDQYKSLIYSLIGKRGSIGRQDFEMIEKLIQSFMDPAKKRKMKRIYKSVHKWNRMKNLDDSLPIFPFCM